MSENRMKNTSGKPSAAKLPLKPLTHSRTDWERVDALLDEEIDTSDIPPLTAADFARSEWRLPSTAPSSGATPAHEVMVEVAVDENTLAWFQSQDDYPQRMRAALRLYAEAHRAAA